MVYILRDTMMKRFSQASFGFLLWISLLSLFCFFQPFSQETRSSIRKLASDSSPNLNLIVFGDSYSDSGKYGYISLFTDSTNVVPQIPVDQYKGNRFTNGRTFVEYTADKAGINLHNYASAYAEALHDRVVMDMNTCKEVTVPSLKTQWETYVGSSNFDKTNLHIIAIGANDLAYLALAYEKGTMGLFSLIKHADRVTDVIISQAIAMNQSGIAKPKIVLVTFPAAWLIPYFLELGFWSDVEIEVLLKIVLEIQKIKFKASKFPYWDLSDEMSTIIDEDKSAGKVTRVACFPYNADGPGLGDCPDYDSGKINWMFGKGCTSKTVEKYSFFDTFHPTNTTHYKLGTAFYSFLKDNVLTKV